MTQQTFSFERALSQMHRLLNLTWPAKRNQHCRSIRLLGNQHGKPGLIPRPVFPCHHQTVQILQPVLLQAKPDLNGIHVPEQPALFHIEEDTIDMTDRTTNWKERIARFRQKFRSRRRPAQPWCFLFHLYFVNVCQCAGRFQECVQTFLKVREPLSTNVNR